MENGRLKEIMEMMREFGVAELKLEDGEERLVLRRESAMASRQPVAAAAVTPRRPLRSPLGQRSRLRPRPRQLAPLPPATRSSRPWWAPSTRPPSPAPPTS